jgi:hypothetical protein
VHPPTEVSKTEDSSAAMYLQDSGGGQAGGWHTYILVGSGRCFPTLQWGVVWMYVDSQCLATCGKHVASIAGYK